MSFCLFYDLEENIKGYAPIYDCEDNLYLGRKEGKEIFIMDTLKRNFTKGTSSMTIPEKIDKSLKQHENHKYCERSLDSIADYIDWAWKWKKISYEEMQSFVDRIVTLFEEERMV